MCLNLTPASALDLMSRQRRNLQQRDARCSERSTSHRRPTRQRMAQLGIPTERAWPQHSSRRSWHRRTSMHDSERRRCLGRPLCRLQRRSSKAWKMIKLSIYFNCAITSALHNILIKNSPLGTGKAVLRPSEWATIHIQHCVLLFNAKPGLLRGDLLRDFAAALAVICSQRGSVIFVSLTPETKRGLNTFDKKFDASFTHMTRMWFPRRNGSL